MLVDGVVTDLALRLSLRRMSRRIFLLDKYNVELAPITLIAATAVVTLTAVLATCLPALRATRVDPLIARRSEYLGSFAAPCANRAP